MFLTHEQLVELTDYQKPSAQIRWLKQNGYKFQIGASGRPKVLVVEAERHGLSARPARRSTAPRLDLVGHGSST